jgi:fumarate reductase subunit C
MIDARLYLLQRLTAIAMLPLIATHLIIMIFAINGGLTAEEILGRTQGSIGWALFYSSFVLFAAVHGAIGFRTILYEWFIPNRGVCSIASIALLITLIGLGLRAVYAVTL